MASTLQQNTFSATYKDDFLDSDNYHRILFNAGKALQARELTQLQTIINKEVERFGRNIFKEGALVRPGGIVLETNREFIKLVNGDADFANVQVGDEFTSNNPSGVKVRVLEKVAASSSSPSTEPDTLYVQYIDLGGQAGGASVIRVADGATLTGPVFNAANLTLTAAASNATGSGSRVSCNNGDYFVQGHFVFANEQSIILSRYSSTPTADIGFKIVENVVTADDDADLYDNQGATPNIAAPGADRYQIKLTLTTRDQLAVSENFVYLAKVENGRIVDQVEKEDIYNTIGDFIALRTKEESGDYVVSPFRASFNNLNDSNLSLDVSSGVAYVDGYRISVDAQTITVPKARSTIELTDQKIPVSYGNYVLVQTTSSNQKGLPNIDTLEKLDLRSATNYGGSTIGTARIRNVEEDGANNRYYLFDIQMTGGNSFASTQSIGTSINAYANLVLEGGLAVLKATNNNSLIFPLPNKSPTFSADGGFSVQSVDYNFRARVQAPADGTGGGTFGTITGATYGGSVIDYVAAETDGHTGAAITLTDPGQGATSLDFSGAGAGSTVEMIATFNVNAENDNHVRTKTLNEITNTVAWNTNTGTAASDSNGSGQLVLDLEYADVYKLLRLRTTDSDGNDLTDLFTFDNGQRDNFYAGGRLIQKPGTTVPTGNIFYRIQYFTHNALSGRPGYFSVESYEDAFNDATLTGGALTGDAAYKAIPDYQKADGSFINLRDALDFRPVQGTAATDAYDTNGGIINFIPRPSSSITASITHYERRKDKLVAVVTNTKDDREGAGQVVLQQGVSSITDAQEPNTPTGSLTLYNFDLNPYTFNESDLTSEFISNKRFTMKDIGRLENRINKIEELTTLSLLELDASSILILDSDDNPRTKAGFLADNFKNEAFSDVTNFDYRAAIDFDRFSLRSTVWPKNNRLIYDSNLGTDVVNKGDMIYLHIDSEQTLIYQDKATQTINVNPFAVITNRGHIDLSPASDDWVEIEYVPDNVVNAPDNVTRRQNRNTTANLATWRNSWFGSPTSGGIGGRVDVIVSSNVVRDEVADRLLEVTLIPWMRSRKVGFRVNGLQPKTPYFAFFGGVSIADWIRGGPPISNTFDRFTLTNDDDGNIYNNATSHPDGFTSLMSDSVGSMAGTFVIPSTPTLRFRSGEQEFKLLNVSVNDNSAATSTARTTFSSQGLIETRQRTIRVTRNIVLDRLTRIREERQDDPSDNVDPVAQSFRVDHIQNPNGTFLTSVDIFFATKSSTVPVQVQIRAMEAGVPTGNPIPGAVKFLLPANVNVQPLATANMTNVRAAPTTFEFDEPVYLSPGIEYAVVILAETIDYNVYVAETNEFIVGSTEARITKQPTLGSLFLSQNARTWTPDQNKDLMFRIRTARFKSSGNVILKNNTLPKYLLPTTNPFESVNATKFMRVFHEGHGFEVGDFVHIAGLPAGSYNNVSASDINGRRTITKADWTGYEVEVGGSNNFNLTARFGETGVCVTQQMHFDTYFPSVQNILPDDTTLSASVRLTNATSWSDSADAIGRNISNNNYSKPNIFTDITLNEFNTLNSPKAVLSDSNETLRLGGLNSFDLKLTLTTSDTKVSPIIDMQRASLTTFENIIDKQVSGGTGGNTPISFVNETNAFGGTHAAKHITTPIELASPAVGLKIILSANRPTEADFQVFHRTATTDEVLTDKPFVEVTREADLAPDDDGITFRDYEFLAGGQAGNLDAFTQFQIKIVMNTTNTSKIPIFKDLRTVALVT